MIKISNFSSVLEIAFAFNALFYIFELAPASDSRLQRKLEEYDSLAKAYIEAKKSSDVFPLGLYIALSYGEYRLLLTLFTVVMSMTSLLLLVYAGFNPETSMSHWLMSCLLLVLFLLLPITATIIYYKASKFIGRATSHLRSEVYRASSEDLEQTEKRASLPPQ